MFLSVFLSYSMDNNLFIHIKYFKMDYISNIFKIVIKVLILLVHV